MQRDVFSAGSHFSSLPEADEDAVRTVTLGVVCGACEIVVTREPDGILRVASILRCDTAHVRLLECERPLALRDRFGETNWIQTA